MKLSKDQRIEFIKQTEETLKEFPDLRIGQVMFNVLYEINPDLADSIRSTDLGPFYDDTRIRKFIKYISE